MDTHLERYDHQILQVQPYLSEIFFDLTCFGFKNTPPIGKIGSKEPLFVTIGRDNHPSGRFIIKNCTQRYGSTEKKIFRLFFSLLRISVFLCENTPPGGLLLKIAHRGTEAQKKTFRLFFLFSVFLFFCVGTHLPAVKLRAW